MPGGRPVSAPPRKGGMALDREYAPSFVRSEDLKRATLGALASRGVTLEQIAEIALFLQKDYVPGLAMDICLKNVEHVLDKREVQNATLTGIELDMLAEKGALGEPLQSILRADESLYGVDEILAMSILNVYGSISYTNYGYVDKIKYGCLARLNAKDGNRVNAFLDDLVGAVAAAAASRIAHHHRDEVEGGD